MNQNDREMLENVALAADIEYGWQHIFDDYEGATCQMWDWNPFEDNNDAFQLLTQFKLSVFQDQHGCRVSTLDNSVWLNASFNPDADLRRAIVMAVAQTVANEPSEG
jgi:hypothetical protein